MDNRMQTPIIQAAIHCREKFGFSVIPVGPDKKPCLQQWREFQKRKPESSEIVKWPFKMIGIVTGSISGILVIDCDTPGGFEAVQRLIPDSLLVPTARTPRGGWHLYFLYPADSKITVGTGLLPGVDFRGEGGYIVAPPSINGEGKGYTWMQGLSLEEVEPPPVPDALLNILNINAYRGADGRPPETTDNHKDHKFFLEGRRDEDIFTVANCLIKGGCKEEMARQVLDILASSCKPPFPRSEVQNKIRSAMQRAERRERNLAQEVREWVETTTGNFSTTECHRELQVTTRDEMKAANMALLRLCEPPNQILEKHGDRRGYYRRIDTSIEFMDFANADIENSIDLSLPLGLHAKTKIFPKGVVVVAGVSGTGKTLFAFNAIAENMRRHSTFYFNSEMGPEALKQKLSHFPLPISEWQKHMKVVDNWDFYNIADKVQPDAFNVIDYLEPEGEKAFNIHGVISAIIKRLNKGTALITVQKKPGATMGTGGIYSIKAATLACALDWGKLEVVKNRFREADQMPTLTKINFEVHQGFKFVPVGSWY